MGAGDSASNYADNLFFDPPFVVSAPKRQTLPVVFDSPHSGRRYPPPLLARSRLDPRTLRRSEDSFVDMIFSGVVAQGAPLIAAQFPRAYVDVNRERYELDPAMFHDTLPSHANTSSARVSGGLGTIPRVVAEGSEIYRDKLTFLEVEARLAALYTPYHMALRDLMNRTQARFGWAVLIDCHSMPSQSTWGEPGESTLPRPDIVLGDRHGTSCAPEVVLGVERYLVGRGYRVIRNSPYAGGYITEHYGRPAEGWHGLQIEINRAIYMNEVTFKLTKGYERLAHDMSFIGQVIAGSMARPLAAE